MARFALTLPPAPQVAEQHCTTLHFPPQCGTSPCPRTGPYSSADRSNSVAVIRVFALDELPKTNMNRAQMINADITFVNGDKGGLEPIAKVNSEQSFYVVMIDDDLEI